jgi:hypothetical protein
MNFTKKWALLALILPILWSCKKEQIADDVIMYKAVNQQYVVKTNVSELQQSNDPISMRIDSILNGTLNADLVGTGQISLDVNSDATPELYFEIVDLVSLNGGYLPDSLDSLAVRVLPGSAEILDNSTFGYPDALEDSASIDANSGNWSDRSTNALGTFANAGLFNGRGERYLGFRFPDSTATGYHYGWVKLNVSTQNDSLEIISYGYQQNSDVQIMAGEQ